MKKGIYYFGLVSLIVDLISVACGVIAWHTLKKDKEARELYNAALKMVKEEGWDDIKIQKIKDGY